MYRDITNVEPEMYNYISNNWSHWNSNEKLKKKKIFWICTKNAFDEFTTKGSYTWNITHNTESNAVWRLQPERWGSPLVQEKYQEEKALWRETSISYYYYYYYYYYIGIQWMWNLKRTIVHCGATGIVTRSLRKNLEAVTGRHSIDSLQKTAVLGTSHILQCEAWSVSGGDHRWFKRSTGKKRPVTRDIHIE